jgi:hypothetical protein
MRIGKVTVGTGLLVLLAGGWYFLSPSPVACNSPDLIQEFQDRFSTSLRELRERLRQEPEPDAAISLKQYADYRLNIKSTATLRQDGNFLACQMSYDYGNPKVTFEFQYSVGKDDAGNLTWRYTGSPPYQIVIN